MASYNFGYQKYVNSEQGNMGLCDIDISGTFPMFNLIPSNVYEFNSVEYYKEHNLFFFAQDYQSWTQTPFPNWFEIGEIQGTHLYGAIYVSNLQIPNTTPLELIPPQNIDLCLVSGDMNGEHTLQNPTGIRIGSFQQFNLDDYINYGVDDIIGVNTHYYLIDSFYGYFGTFNSGGYLYFFSAPRKKVEKEKINNEPLEYMFKHTTATQGELTTMTEYDGMQQLDIRTVTGDLISIDDLPEEESTSTTGGGGVGLFNLQSDEIDFPALPTLGAANSGLLTLYNPTISQLFSLSNWLWSNDLLDNLTKMFAQPLDLIISLSISPCPPSSLGSTQAVKIGGVNTGINMQKITNQYAVVDCGTLNLKECYGSALDFGQYTKITLFLPFCNTITLKTDEVMDSQIHIKYHVDLFSGSFTCFVKITRGDLKAILYSLEGNMCVSLPLTSRDFSNVYQNLIKTSIGMTAGMVQGGSLAGTVAVNSALNVMQTKPTVQRTGSTSATGGLLGIKKPYLIIERPNQSLAQNYGHYAGYPSNITTILKSLKGYTEVEEIYLDNLKCTNEEKDIIERLLKEGVII